MPLLSPPTQRMENCQVVEASRGCSDWDLLLLSVPQSRPLGKGAKERGSPRLTPVGFC